MLLNAGTFRNMSAFIPYPSVENGGYARTRPEAFADTIPWIVTHKYHGANFIVRVGSDDAVTYGRRNGFLKPDEKFNGFQKAIEGLSFEKVAGEFMTTMPPLVAVWIYMELYGGVYPGATKTGATPVQQGIYYSDVNRVRVFDIFVQTADAEGVYNGDTDAITGTNELGQWVSFATMTAACARYDIPVVKTSFEGSYEDAFAWAQEHVTDLADAEADMPTIPENVCEGHVVRASTGHYLVKIKGPEWSEFRAAAQKGPLRGKDAAATSADPALQFVTPGRVTSVLSKLTDDERCGNVKTIVGLLIVDVLKDMGSDAPPASRALTNACFTAVNIELRRK